MHYGDNGMLKGAETAVDKYQNKAEQEQNELAKIDDYIYGNRNLINLPIPDYSNKVDLTPYSSASNVYTTPCDGYFLLRSIALNGGKAFNLYLDKYSETEGVIFLQENNSQWNRSSAFLPLEKGSKIYYVISGSGEVNIGRGIYFIPIK